MIHTKEPANKMFVFVTAYRAIESHEVNENFTIGLERVIRKYPGTYGNIRETNITGCFREAGQDVATTERTLKVECTEKQAAELTYLACCTYEQDAVLVVNSQTHTAALWSIGGETVYKKFNPKLVETPLDGTLQRVDAPSGECYSIINGEFWEVVA